jgi:two-component system sensor histidine kinase DesK
VVILMMMLPPRPALICVLVTFVLVAISTRVVPGWHPDISAGLSLVLTAVVMWGIVQMVERNAELARAQEQLADLAVINERTRFARDLHDLLGHSLTLLAIKAELAGRLVQLDAVRAEQEIAEVERLARDALVDVRAAVSGYRKTTLSGELVSARAVLDAAGIRVELPNSVDQVPGERREMLGWAVREGVTNVVRHSGARRCRIEVDPRGVQISDDGCGPTADGPAAGPATADGARSGHGLAGLRERAEAAGAGLTVGRSAEGGFLLRVGW